MENKLKFQTMQKHEREKYKPENQMHSTEQWNEHTFHGET